MRRCFKALVLLSLLAFSTASAQEPPQELDGAFGVKFGRLMPKELSADCKGKNCAFSPNNPAASFDSYTALITPRNRKVYEIVAQGSVADYAACVQQGDKLAASVKQQYGIDLEISQSTPGAVAQTMQWAKDIGRVPKASYTDYQQSDNRKRISIDCTKQSSNYKVSITFTDRFVVAADEKSGKRSLTGF